MRSRHGALPYREFVYDHDPSEVEVLGWDEFIARQWESIFIGYRSWVGLRRMGRRWSDLIEAGLGWAARKRSLTGWSKAASSTARIGACRRGPMRSSLCLG
jgi:hypothetical protein